jgi:hypothetical protein
LFGEVAISILTPQDGAETVASVTGGPVGLFFVVTKTTATTAMIAKLAIGKMTRQT